MTQTIQFTMTGQLPFPPYQSVFWTCFNQADNTGALSGYGANYLINVGVDSVTINGAQVDPFSLQVGGDLTGSLPNPYVSGLQGNPIAATTPISGQFLGWNGTHWTPSSVSGDISTGNIVADGYIHATGAGVFGGSLSSASLSTGPITSGNIDITGNLTASGSLTVPSILTTLVSSQTPSGNIGINSSTGVIDVVSGGDVNLSSGAKAEVSGNPILLSTTTAGLIRMNWNSNDRAVFSYDSPNSQVLLDLKTKGKIASTGKITLQSSGGDIAVTSGTASDVSIGSGRDIYLDNASGRSIFFNNAGNTYASFSLAATDISCTDTINLTSGTTTTIHSDVVNLVADSVVGFDAPGIDIDKSRNFVLSQIAQTSDVATNNITLQSQAPYASATGSNRLPGNIVLDIPAAAGALATANSGNVIFKFGGTDLMHVQALPAVNTGLIDFQVNGQIASSGTLALSAYDTISFESVSNNIVLSSDVAQVNVIAGTVINLEGGLNITDPGGYGINIDGSGGGGVSITAGAGFDIYGGQIGFHPTGGGTSVTLQVGDNGTAAGDALIVEAGGASTGSGVGGNLKLAAGTGSNFNGNVGINMDAPAGSLAAGHFCIYIANASTVPTTNPTGGGVLYVQAGALKYRGSSGTITTLGNA